MVKIEGLTKSFSAHTLFKELTLEFPRGSLTVIMGPSGCGKSTLLRCINFLELFDKGKICIGDLSVAWQNGEAEQLPAEKKSMLQKMRLKTGMVFQSFNLFPHLTVLENVTLAPIQVKKVEQHEAMLLGKRILERVGLSQKVDAYPSKLSGGQQQRVAIARALVNQPALLLADEPTGNLDSQTSIEIMGVFQKLNDQGITIVMVTHELDIASYTRRNIIMRDGRVVTDEPVKNRFIAEDELRKLREAQQAVNLA